MSSVLVSDQHASNSVTHKKEFENRDVPVVETALAHAHMSKLAARTESGLDVTISELPVRGMLVLRAKDTATLQGAVKKVLQLTLPDKLLSDESDDCCIRWIAPDEWLVSCASEDAFHIEKALRESTASASFAVVNVSGGFTSLQLRGVRALDVLRKSTPYDVHPINFSAGKVVNTVLAKTQVCLRCIDSERYEIIVRRSFADYLWHWLQVASAEYGLSIELA